MKITKISIRNFRSIRSADIDCTNFNIFVGQNNAGKTNLFEAIEWFFNGTSRQANLSDLRFQRRPENKMEVSITFEGAQEGVRKMKHEGNRKKLLNTLGESDEVTIIRRCKNDRKRSVIVGGEEKKPGTGFDRALNDFLPKFEYIHTKQYYDAVARFTQKTPVGIMLSEVLNTILEENEQYQNFQETFRQLFDHEDSAIRAEFDRLGGAVQSYLSKQFPDCTKVSFQVGHPAFTDLLKNFETRLDDGVLTTAEEKGDGMQRALMLAIIQAYAEYRREREEASKSFLFFIDEAELHLHPSAQRNLKEVLLELAGGADQVFINTHSSVFVVDSHEEQQIFKVEKPGFHSEIQPVAQVEKHYVVYDLLGGSPADVLMPRNFLIVEGESEYQLLTTIVKRFYTDKPAIQIIKARGDIRQTKRVFYAIEKTYAPLNQSLYRNRVVILCDQASSQRENAVKQFMRDHPHLTTNQQYFELPEADLEACYPDCNGWKKTREQMKNDAISKARLAREVANGISQEQFEQEMPVLFQALSQCWALAY